MTNDRRVYILPLVNYNAYWSIIGHLYYITSFFNQALYAALQRIELKKKVPEKKIVEILEVHQSCNCRNK